MKKSNLCITEMNITATLLFSTLLLVVGNVSALVSRGEVGKPISVSLKLPDPPLNLERCSIRVITPGGVPEIVVLTAPNFEHNLRITLQSPGTFQVLWEGVHSLKGKEVANPIEGAVKQLFGNVGELLQFSEPSLSNVACPGSGSLLVESYQSSTIQSTETIKKKPTGLSNGYASSARIPTPPLKKPIEALEFRKRYNEDGQYREMIDGFLVKRSGESLALLSLFADKGDAYAQFLFGKAQTESWTGLSNPSLGCYWIRKAAEGGLSQARMLIATKAFEKSSCFDITPTLEEARIWAELAKLSTDQEIKKSAELLLGKILEAQLSGRK